MFRFIKFLFWLVFLAAFVWFGATVPLGKATLFGHVKRIWKSEETQDLVNGTKDAASPTVKRVKRAVEKGLDEAKKPNPTEKAPAKEPEKQQE